MQSARSEFMPLSLGVATECRLPIWEKTCGRTDRGPELYILLRQPQ